MQRSTNVLLGALALVSAGCTTGAGFSYHSSSSTRAGDSESGGTPRQIALLGADLEERAGARVQLGSMRILVEDFEQVRRSDDRPHGRRIGEPDRRAITDTLRTELELSLGNKLNIVDPSAFLGAAVGASIAASERRSKSGATHVLVGTWSRAGDALDITARLVDLRDGWIVATAQRRIGRFRAREVVGRTSESDFRAPRPAEAIATVATERGPTELDPTELDPTERRGLSDHRMAASGMMRPSRSAYIDDPASLSDEFIDEGLATNATFESPRFDDPRVDDYAEGALIEFDEGPAAARLRIQVVPGAQDCPPPR